MKSKTTRNVLDNICDQCNSSSYCTLKELLLVTQRFDNRVLIQIKCIEIFKYEESERQGFDIGWSAAGLAWVDQGWAALFDENFDTQIDPRELYKKIKAQLQ